MYKKNFPKITLKMLVNIFLNPKKIGTFFRGCFSIRKPKMRFSGHYIVLCGYDNRIGSVFYRNPAHDDRKLNFSILPKINTNFKK